MYKRHMASKLRELARSYPVVTLTGPRQSGKTTLVREVFPEMPYANLEQPDHRKFAQDDPRAFLEQFPDGAILDEIHQAPELLSYIQVIVDEAGREGMFILAGSHQLEVHQAISQSLAGRTGLLFLLPMSLQELTEAGFDYSIDDWLLHGGYPRIYSKRMDPTQAYRDYMQTYVERDLRQLIHVKDLALFQKFMGLCAGRIGQLLNFDGLANEVGVSSPTIKHWISVLEAMFVLFRLQPYSNNFGKRLVKTPKIYFTDVGLASYLLGIENTTQMARDPLRGNLFENLVVLELMKARTNRGREPRLYYYRDRKGNEVDLIYQSGHDLIPVEVKSGQTYRSEFLKGLKFFQAQAGERVSAGYLVYGGDAEQAVGDFELLNYLHASRAITDVQSEE